MIVFRIRKMLDIILNEINYFFLAILIFTLQSFKTLATHSLKSNNHHCTFCKKDPTNKINKLTLKFHHSSCALSSEHVGNQNSYPYYVLNSAEDSLTMFSTDPNCIGPRLTDARDCAFGPASHIQDVLICAFSHFDMFSHQSWHSAIRP